MAKLQFIVVVPKHSEIWLAMSSKGEVDKQQPDPNRPDHDQYPEVSIKNPELAKHDASGVLQ